MTWRLIGPIWRLPDVTASQRLVLLALASFTDKNGGNAYPSQSTLARMACCSGRTVRRALADLIALELITPNGKGRRGTIRYSVNANVLGREDTSGHSPRTPVSYNPSDNNPGNYPGKRDYYINSRNPPAIQVDRFSTTSPADYDIRTGRGGAMAMASAARSRKR